MDQSYLERAKRWIETADDVDIDNLESTLARFVAEHKKGSLDPNKTPSDLEDLKDTIKYLEGELQTLAGVDQLPTPMAEIHDANDVAARNSTDYTYDPSPLIDPAEPEVMRLSDAQRRSALAKIKTMPGVISAEALAKAQIQRRA